MLACLELGITEDKLYNDDSDAEDNLYSNNNNRTEEEAMQISKEEEETAPVVDDERNVEIFEENAADEENEETVNANDSDTDNEDDCTNQQPPQRGGAVPSPVWVGSKWLLAFSRVPVTPGTPLYFFAMLPTERPQKSSTQHL